MSKRKYKKPDPAPTGREVAALFDALPPHNPDAEMSLLGSLILAGARDVHIIDEAIGIVKAEHFFIPRHAELFTVISKLVDQLGTLDSVLLTDTLRSRDSYAAVGGIDYIVELAESVPTCVNAPHYARIVRDKAKARGLIEAAATIMRDAHENHDDMPALADKAEKLIYDAVQSAQTNEPQNLSTIVEQQMDKYQREAGEGVTGIPSGYYRLDEMLCGLQPGDMIILAARPSMGKTSLALNIAENIAFDPQAPAPVAFFSLEMGREQVGDRLLSARAGVDSQKMRRGMCSDEEIQRLQAAAAELKEAKIFVDDTPGISAMELRSKSRYLVSQEGVRAIFIDYMQLASYPDSENRVQEVSSISRAVKALAREVKVPVVCLSQLNRNPEGRDSKEPRLSDLRESGAIEQDADVVMMLHREEYYHLDDPNWKVANPGQVGAAKVIVAKQRNGPTGHVKLRFNHKSTRFENWSNAAEPEPSQLFPEVGVAR